MRRICLLVLICLQVSCHSGRELAAESGAVQTRTGFLAFRMHGQAAAPPVLTLLDYQQVSGTFKAALEPGPEQPDRLTILMYRKGRLLDSQQAPHPLILHAEHAGESGAFESRQVRLDSAEFFIRVRLASAPDEVRVLEYRYNQPVRHLTPISLPAL